MAVMDRGKWTHDAHSEPPGEAHSRGRVHYRNKQYQAALKCFSQAINEGTEDLIGVLDNRSATYSKLGNYQSALLDGQRMIRQDKTNVTGYLRAGKVLTQMGKFETARGLYEMGIGKVQDSSPNSGLLKESCAKVVELIDSAKHLEKRLEERADPFHTLPLEIAQMIFNNFAFPDICRCTRVSKSWLKLLGSMSILWTDLNFFAANQSKKSVGLGAIRHYIKRGNGLPTRVTLPKRGMTTDNIPRFITTRCKGLYELVITGGLVGATILKAAPCAINLRTLIVGSQCDITGDTVDQLLERCRFLERAEFHSVCAVSHRPAQWNADLPKLQSLTMVFTKTKGNQHNFVEAGKLVKHIPNIRKLVLRGGCWFCPSTIPDFSLLKQLETLDISGMVANRGPKYPSSLHSLDISRNNSPLPDIVPDQFTQLVRFSFANTHNAEVYYRKMLEANKGQLTHLDATKGLSGRQLEELVVSGYLQGVVELKLGMCPVNDDLAAMLAMCAPNIKKLYLENTSITGVGVKALVNTLNRKLEFLCLDECWKCSPDANTWAMSMGVKTSFKFPDYIRGGRKLPP